MMTKYDRVLLAREKERPTAGNYISNLVTHFVEMHGDRRYGDDRAVIAGIGLLEDEAVTLIGIEKGHDTKEKIECNFGSAHPEGYRKALRQMKLAEKFHRPVICIIDTAGAYCGIGAEERGEGQAIAENLMEMMMLKTPVISIVIGEGGSGGALALAVADEVWMLSNAYYSVVSPESCANILWKDTNKAAQAADALKLTATDLLEMSVIERIVEEPRQYQYDIQNDIFYGNLKKDLLGKIQALESLDVEQLLENRYEKYRKIGRNNRVTI